MENRWQASGGKKAVPVCTLRTKRPNKSWKLKGKTARGVGGKTN